MKAHVRPGQIIVDVAKGIEEATLMTMTDIIEEEIPQAEVAVLSGPSHAEEGWEGSADDNRGGRPQKRDGGADPEPVHDPVIPRLYDPDMLGIEIGAALKNVIAPGQPVSPMGWAMEIIQKPL